MASEMLTVAEAADLIGVDATSIQGKRSLPGSCKARVPVVDKRGRTVHVNRTFVPRTAVLAEIDRRRARAEKRADNRPPQLGKAERQEEAERGRLELEQRRKQLRPGYISVAEAALVIGLSAPTVSEYIRRERLAGIKHRTPGYERETWLVLRSAAEALRDKRVREAEAARRRELSAVSIREAASLVFTVDTSEAILPAGSPAAWAVVRACAGKIPNTREECLAFRDSEAGAAERTWLAEKVAA